MGHFFKYKLFVLSDDVDLNGVNCGRVFGRHLKLATTQFCSPTASPSSLGNLHFVKTLFLCKEILYLYTAKRKNVLGWTCPTTKRFPRLERSEIGGRDVKLNLSSLMIYPSLKEKFLKMICSIFCGREIISL